MVGSQRSSWMVESVSISESFEEVIRMFERRGVLGWLGRLKSASAMVDKLALATTRFEADSVQKKAYFETAFRDTYSSTDGFFREFVRKGLDEDLGVPLSQFHRLVETLDRRSMTDKQTRATWIGAVVGGLIGSLLTATLSSPAPPASKSDTTPKQTVSISPKTQNRGGDRNK